MPQDPTSRILGEGLTGQLAFVGLSIKLRQFNDFDMNVRVFQQKEQKIKKINFISSSQLTCSIINEELIKIYNEMKLIYRENIYFISKINL